MFFFILYVTFFFFVKNNNIAVARCPYLGSYIQLFYQALKHWTFFWWRLLCWRPGNLRKKKKKKKNLAADSVSHGVHRQGIAGFSQASQRYCG